MQMNNEIKEILENIKNKYEDYYVQDIVSNNDLKQLLDYITNLQEKEIEKDAEIKELNDDIEWWTNRFNAVERDKREYKARIDKANNLLQEILVVEDWEHKGRFRPVKNTSSQDVYKTICKLTELLETPHKINYGLLQGSDKE